MPVDQVFPCLDLMRLLVLFEPAIHHYSSEKQLLKKILTTCTEANVCGPTKIIALRLFCNLFWCDVGASLLTSLHFLEPLVKLVTEILNHSTGGNFQEKIRSATVTLLYNLSLYIPKKDSDELVQCLSCILYFIPRNTVATEVHLLLLSLGHLLYCNDAAVDLVSVLGFEVGKWESNSVRLSAVVKEIRQMLE
eukprot:TRINITY_DN3219_c0_g2_i12.p1 TRINITY_DN3219_c0_g2~~TRINITY_DN3219_c0_g2_i12.p1  ORF type:complete len:193 (+),score=35.08 TRINITY_DN3219_c0_g2_i12:1171-1749(+)